MKLAACVVLLATTSALRGQQSVKDSIRKNEVSINVLPAFALAAGAMPSTASLFSLDYARQISQKYFLNAGIGIQPFQRQLNYFGPQYYATVGDKNVFQDYLYMPATRFMGTIGVEKRFRKRRFEHGPGASLILTYQAINILSSYTWALKGEAPYGYALQGDTTNHVVDSLGFYERQRNAGIGVYLHYSLRFHLSKRFLIFIQGGTTCSLIISERRKEDYKTDKITTGRHTFLEPYTLPFISRFSVAYRF